MPIDSTSLFISFKHNYTFCRSKYFKQNFYKFCFRVASLHIES